MPNWTEILIHHSASPADTPWDGIVAYHVTPPPRGRGWRAVGYHFGIAKQGDGYAVQTGRSLIMPGAHCPGHNSTALGVCLVGDFTTEAPPAAQLWVAADLCADLCRRFDVRATHIRPHRAFRKTECPGRAFTDSLFARFRQSVLDRMTHG